MRYTTALNLALYDVGDKWNNTTWNTNMELLDTFIKTIQDKTKQINTSDGIFTNSVTAPNFIGNASSSTKLLNARNITIGKQTKVFDGTSAIAFDLVSIGAADRVHTHDYLPLSGGIITGSITVNGKINGSLIGGGASLTDSLIINKGDYLNILMRDSKNNARLIEAFPEGMTLDVRESGDDKSNCRMLRISSLSVAGVGSDGLYMIDVSNNQYNYYALLHSGNYPTILDNRYYTETEIENIFHSIGLRDRTCTSTAYHILTIDENTPFTIYTTWYNRVDYPTPELYGSGLLIPGLDGRFKFGLYISQNNAWINNYNVESGTVAWHQIRYTDNYTFDGSPVIAANNYIQVNRTDGGGLIKRYDGEDLLFADGNIYMRHTFYSGYISDWINSKASLSGYTMNTNAIINMVATNTSHTGIKFTMADNDFGRIVAFGSSNNGYLSIDTGDDGNEPIICRQYTGEFTNLVREAHILDGQGNTYFPGALTVQSSINAANGTVSGSEITSRNWLRSTGATGWYNETFGGGWYMTDDSWIRSYNNKHVYCNGEIRANRMSVETGYISEHLYGLRQIYGNCAAIHYFDGANFYLMFTNYGDTGGGYNDLRPFTANAQNGYVTMSHNVYGGNIYSAVWNDYAEYYERGSETRPGDIIMLDLESEEEKYILATELSDHVVGVHSDSYGFCVGGDKRSENDTVPEKEFQEKKYIPVGLNGRVKTKIIGPIHKGDYIVVSSIPGVGRKWDQETEPRYLTIGFVTETNLGPGIKRVQMQLKTQG